MFQQTFHIARFLPLLGVLFFTSISLEAQNEIVQNDDAVLLRRIWMVRGGVVGGDRVGEGAGAIGDVNHSGLPDLAVLIGATAEWRVYVDSNNVHTTNPYWTFDSGAGVPWRPVLGDFRGDGNLLVGFTRADIREIRGVNHMTARLMFYELKDSLGKQEEPAMVLNTASYQDSSSAYPRDILVSDIDNDGDDELLLVFGSFLRDLQRTAKAEIWIFEGGPEFQLDTPTVVLKDTEENLTDVYAAVGDLDGDSLPDLMIGANYVGTGPGNRPIRYKFWWGKNRLSDLSIIPDHSVTLDKASVNIDAKFTLLDCDGDGVKDILRLLYATPLGVYLYRSAAGKNIRDRQLTIDDADGYFPGYSIFGSGGYLGDSLQRFESIIMLGARVMFFQGGKNGPNYSYDAYYSAADDGLTPGNVFGQGGPVGDVSGNGWEDYLTANPGWFNLEQGIVILLEGGPYIPTDDTTSGVEVVATVEHGSALHIWPNPVTDELHVAWRGDLKASPSLLRVYDMSGRLVVEGSIQGWQGEALWRCNDVTSGSYLLVVYDRDEQVIAQHQIIKQ